jgi:hypothetical protein
MATKKVTISLDASELAWLEAHARRVHGGNVSAAFVDGLRALRRREALRAFLRASKAPRLSREEVVEVLAEVRGAPPKAAGRRRRAA